MFIALFGMKTLQKDSNTQQKYKTQQNCYNFYNLFGLKIRGICSNCKNSALNIVRTAFLYWLLSEIKQIIQYQIIHKNLLVQNRAKLRPDIQILGLVIGSDIRVVIRLIKGSVMESTMGSVTGFVIKLVMALFMARITLVRHGFWLWGQSLNVMNCSILLHFKMAVSQSVSQSPQG